MMALHLRLWQPVKAKLATTGLVAGLPAHVRAAGLLAGAAAVALGPAP